MRWASSKSTPTIRSRRSSFSTSTTSMPPSQSSTPATSPAKRPPTRAHGRSSRVATPRSTGTNYRRPRRTASSIDHRRGAAFAPGDLIEYFRAGWELGQDIRTYVEVVHRLSDLGAVCTHAGHGVSHEGFDAEWRGVDLLTVEGDMVNRCEVFDDADLDAAIARFDELSRPAPRLENAASHVYERFQACFAARDWAALADITGRRLLQRRSSSGGECRRPIGRDAVIETCRSGADLGLTHATSESLRPAGSASS